MGINSPGKIQRWSEWEFESVPNNMELSGVEASRNAYKAASNIVRSWSDGMEPLAQPQFDFNAASLSNTINRGLDISVMGSNLSNMRRVPTSANASVTNREVTNNDNTRQITIENITLQCNELTQAQSRRVLYNALQGL